MGATLAAAVMQSALKKQEIIVPVPTLVKRYLLWVVGVHFEAVGRGVYSSTRDCAQVELYPNGLVNHSREEDKVQAGEG